MQILFGINNAETFLSKAASRVPCFDGYPASDSCFFDSVNGSFLNWHQNKYPNLMFQGQYPYSAIHNPEVPVNNLQDNDKKRYHCRNRPNNF